LLVLDVSLTLRDAQHLCWKSFKKLATLDPEKSKAWTPSATASDLLRGAEQISGLVRNSEAAGSAEPEAEAQLASKLSDLLYSILILAEHYGIEFEESFLQTVNDYALKFI
jgi:NTP pyrophosphatase (non-canonical NTP hydrolase)